MSNSDIITVAVAASLLKVHKRTVVRWIETGVLDATEKLPAKTGAYLLSRAAVEALAAERAA